MEVKMHDCEATQERLADLLSDELGGADEALLRAELARCGACRGEHRALAAALETFELAAAAHPSEEFWPGYGERLRARMAQEIGTNVWRQGALFQPRRAEYHVTFLEDEGLGRRLARELRAAAHASRLTWPEFERDPLGFTRRTAETYARLAGAFFAQRNVAAAALTSFLFVSTVGLGLFAVENRCSVLGLFSRPCEMAARDPHGDLEVVGIIRGTDIPREQAEPEEGPAGTRKGTGGGSKPEQERPRGGGGGGRRESLPASAGRMPTAQLGPQLLTPNPHPPAVRSPKLPTPVTLDVDPALIKPDARDVPYGLPDSNQTVASAGPGTNRGMGTGNNGGLGEGDGGGVGPGEGGNIGGDRRGPGGGGPGGGGGGRHPAVNYARTFRIDEVTQRARILSKPEPGFTEVARRESVTGTVRLRAILTAAGEVRDISVLKGLPGGLTEKAIEAARRIRFQPARKDGHAVSQWVTLEYNFNIY